MVYDLLMFGYLEFSKKVNIIVACCRWWVAVSSWGVNAIARSGEPGVQKRLSSSPVTNRNSLPFFQYSRFTIFSSFINQPKSDGKRFKKYYTSRLNLTGNNVSTYL
jgi:hypothetical protein